MKQDLYARIFIGIFIGMLLANIALAFIEQAVRSGGLHLPQIQMPQYERMQPRPERLYPGARPPEANMRASRESLRSAMPRASTPPPPDYASEAMRELSSWGEVIQEEFMKLPNVYQQPEGEK